MSCAVRVGDPAKGNFDLLLIDVFGVVGTAVPFERLFGLLAAFAGDVFNELKVARRTAAVLGPSSAFTSQEAGVGFSGLRRLDGFDDNPMRPVIAKIIHVAELCYPGCQECG